MSTIRGVVAVSLLNAYWLGRRVVTAALFVVAVASWVREPGPWALAVSALAVAAGVLSYRTNAVLRVAVPEPEGALVPPSAESALWRQVWDLCQQLQARPPDEIRLDARPRIAVSEEVRGLGLLSGSRHLHLGLPLLAGLTAEQLHAILVHELAHDSAATGRLAATCHRLRTSLGRVLDERPATRGLLFALVARTVLAIEAPVSRRQERRADRSAVRHAGRVAVADALRELPVLSVAWERYLAEVLTPALRSGYAPINLVDGFGHVRHVWRRELAAVRTAPPAETVPSWDPHPHRLERLHAMYTEPGPDVVGSTTDWRSGLTAAVREVERALVGPVRRVPWDEFCGITASQELRAEVDQLFRAARDVAARAGSAAQLVPLRPGGELVPESLTQLDTVLALIEAGTVQGLVQRLHPPTNATVRRLLALAFAQAAVDRGLARWRRGPSGALEVVRPDGGQIPVDELAARVIADRTSVPMVRDVLRAVRGTHPAALVAGRGG